MPVGWTTLATIEQLSSKTRRRARVCVARCSQASQEREDRFLVESGRNFIPEALPESRDIGFE